MENLDIRTVLPLLQQMGIRPDTLGPERIQKLIQIADKIKNPSQINQNIIDELRDVIGITNPTPNLNPNTPTPRSKKVPRNSKCPCESGLKWKKCCGQFLS